MTSDTAWTRRAQWGPRDQDAGRRREREFAKRHSPWMIGGAILALVAVRVLIGEPLTWRDAVAVAAMLVVYPFGEWAIHVYLLHAKPIAIRGRRFELPTTRDHRYHHRHPNNLFTLLLNAKELAELLLLAVPFVVVAARRRRRADRRRRCRSAPWSAPRSPATCWSAIYEWTHYLIHTAYRRARARTGGSGATTACTTSRTSTTGTGSRTRSPTACSAPIPDQREVPRSQTARTLDPGPAS